MHLSDNHALQAGDVALLGRHFEVAVDDAAKKGQHTLWHSMVVLT